MSHTPHELHEEFPQQAERLRELKASNPHFAHLAERYHEVNRAVHRAETDVEPTGDAHMTELRRERMRLKDEIAGILSDSAA